MVIYKELFMQGSIEVKCPATLEKIGEFPIMGEKEVKEAVQKARAAQKSWWQLGFDGRKRILIRCRKALVEHMDELLELLTKETGKPRMEALTHELFPLCELITYFAKKAKRILKKKKIKVHLLKTKSAYLYYKPMGVIGIIAPWNFPMSISIGEVVMALAAGNGAVLKPSELTTLINLKVRELFIKAGLPEDIFQIVTGDGTTGAYLVSSNVNKICFTGSVRTGRKVYEGCAQQLKPCILELGGKDPAIVLDDADIETTAKALVWGAFANCGQVCASVERAYIHESIYDDLKKKILEETTKIRQGFDESDHYDVGSITMPGQLDIIESHIKDAVEKGAIILRGGKRPEDKKDGYWFEPTVLENVDHSMKIITEETFGPVLPLLKFKNIDEAIKMANDTKYGLSAYVFSSSIKRARQVAERLEAGTVMINSPLYTHSMAETPWGGIKESGVGITHSDDGLRSLCHVVHVNYPSFWVRWLLKKELWWYPYNEKNYRLFRSMTRLLFK